jgi:hypothetical protein
MSLRRCSNLLLVNNKCGVQEPSAPNLTLARAIQVEESTTALLLDNDLD